MCNNEGNVTEVQLAGLGLAGPLPPGLADLNVVETLNLSGNAFEGPLPGAGEGVGAVALGRSSLLIAVATSAAQQQLTSPLVAHPLAQLSGSAP